MALGCAHAQHGLDAFGQALGDVGAHLDAVDHHVHVVLVVFFQLGQLFVLVQLAVHTKAHIALRQHLCEQLVELALFLSGEWCQQHQARAFGQLQDGIHHLAHGLRRQRHAVLGAVRRARARPQQAQVVVDFRHRAHGGARVVAGGFLLDGNGGRQALDQIHVGFIEPPQKLPRVGREAFHIAALAFGVQRVKRQAGLARARQPGNHHQLVAWNVEVDVFQVVRARPPDADAGSAWGGKGRGRGLGHGKGARASENPP